MAKTVIGNSSDFIKWLSVDSLHCKACKYLKDSVDANLSTEIERIDFRKKEGVLKFIFKTILLPYNSTDKTDLF